MSVDAVNFQVGLMALEDERLTNVRAAGKLEELKENRATLIERIDQHEAHVEDLVKQVQKEANRKWWDVPKYFSDKKERLANEAERTNTVIAKDSEKLEQVRDEQKTEFDEVLAAQDKSKSAIDFANDLQQQLRSVNTDLA